MKWTEEKIKKLGEINKLNKISRYFEFKKFAENLFNGIQENIELSFNFLVKLEKEGKIIISEEGKKEIEQFLIEQQNAPNTSNN